MRNDTWVVPYNILLLKGFALYRGAIRMERHAFQLSLRPSTNLNHFYPVAGARQGGKPPPSKSRWTGFCAEAAGNSSTEYGYTKIRTTGKGEQKSP